jgi:hypothetical protein
MIRSFCVEQGHETHAMTSRKIDETQNSMGYDWKLYFHTDTAEFALLNEGS